MPTHEEVRSWFPSLASGFAYLENAGGSQVPVCVADAVRDVMLSDFVQIGAGYPQSVAATSKIADAHDFTESLMNAGRVGKVVLGPSTTALIVILANAYRQTMQPGDEVVVAVDNHEANIGPWVALEKSGIRVRFWPVDPATFECRVDDLRPLLNDRTRIVAMPHASNLIGSVTDVAGAVEMAHGVGARVVVDGVAYAPHHRVDVDALGADWYTFSCYKVYGPHMAVLFGRDDAFSEIEGPNHFFIPRESIPYKFELGGVSLEACAGWNALWEYLWFLGPDFPSAFQMMESLERPLTAQLLEYLRSKPSVRIVGASQMSDRRVGTVSFLHDRLSPPEIVAAVDGEGIGIRYGSMYAWRLCEALGIDPVTGVVRVSLLHYNTSEEIDRLARVLDRVL